MGRHSFPVYTERCMADIIDDCVLFAIPILRGVERLRSSRRGPTRYMVSRICIVFAMRLSDLAFQKAFGPVEQSNHLKASIGCVWAQRPDQRPSTSFLLGIREKQSILVRAREKSVLPCNKATTTKSVIRLTCIETAKEKDEQLTLYHVCEQVHCPF